MRIDLIHDSGGYREEETPCPISNQEAKLFIADNTLSYWDGNVGRCQFRDFFTSFYFPFFNYPILFTLNIHSFVYKYICILSLSWYVSCMIVSFNSQCG